MLRWQAHAEPQAGRGAQRQLPQCLAALQQCCSVLWLQQVLHVWLQQVGEVAVLMMLMLHGTTDAAGCSMLLLLLLLGP
jgi:hypothetical protein